MNNAPVFTQGLGAKIPEKLLDFEEEYEGDTKALIEYLIDAEKEVMLAQINAPTRTAELEANASIEQSQAEREANHAQCEEKVAAINANSTTWCSLIRWVGISTSLLIIAYFEPGALTSLINALIFSVKKMIGV